MPTGTLTQRVVPSLLVNDIEETVAFYKKLGFAISGVYPNEQNATWAEMERDGVTFQFYSEPPRGTSPAPVCSGTFYFFPQCLDELVKELQGEVEFVWGPEVMDYGMREFGIRDPNGYYLAFTEPA